MSQEIGQDWDKVIVIPLWRYYKPTGSVKVQKGTHKERHEPSQTVRVIEDCRILFFTTTLEKNITEPLQRSFSFIPFPSLKLRRSDSFHHNRKKILIFTMVNYMLQEGRAYFAD